ncbi:MAG: sodium:solute symporter family protein [Planctomycetota bacterium]|nr:sodium:solute symporter family protein [Planctomycetota bacterium]MDA0920086.1 sodium:solute symporter family protein [Planctomycetota bacterium]MDA1161300.1 sodium:solute symporter family protein [Planctomycetota bacterium]
MQLFDTNFTSLDWGVVVAYLVISIFVGIWANRYVGNIAGYLVAGRTLRIRLALATMTGTEIGLVTVMYSAELGFTQQYASLYLALYELVILLFIGLTGVVVYRLRESRVLTIPEFYEKRYSRGVRVLGGVMMVMSGVLNMGLFLKAGALFLVSVTGFTEPEWLQRVMVDTFDYHEPVGLKLIMTALLVLVLFYTVLGGMISVVITDLIQFVILGTAMVVVTLFVVGEVGIDGFSEVVTQQHGYFDPTSTDNPSTAKLNDGIGPVTLTAQFVVLSVALMLWPTGVSRTLAVKTPEIARQLYLCSTIPFLARRSLPVLWGIGAFAFFHSHPGLNEQFQAALQSGGDVNTQAAMPLFLAKIIPSGLLGLVTAGMVAAFMSTHDSYLLCWSGVITQDVVAPLMKKELTNKQRILITRVAIVATGAMLLTWGLWYEVSSNLWQYMAITGTVYLAGVFPVVIGGLYWRRSSSAGAYIALLAGLTGILGLDPCVKFLNSQLVALGTTIAVDSNILMLMTFAISLLGFVAGSLLYPDDRANVSKSVTSEGAAQ